MQIETFASGPVDTNAYLVADEEAGEAWVIDAPPDSARPVLDAAAAHGWRVVALVNTHGHWDHIADNAAVLAETGVPLLIHPADEPMIRQPRQMGFARTDIAPTQADEHLNDGDTRVLGRYTFTVWHTPGHSPGGVVLYEPTTGTLIGGDTLFPGGHGRIDIPGASKDEIRASIARLATLPPETVVYPGHGATTTVGAELPWMQLLARGR